MLFIINSKYISWCLYKNQTSAYSCKTNLAMPYNKKLDSTIHTSHTNGHLDLTMSIINRIYKNL